eukprot:5646626-Pleurochrysis_carterae.AAC.1
MLALSRLPRPSGTVRSVLEGQCDGRWCWRVRGWGRRALSLSLSLVRARALAPRNAPSMAMVPKTIE